MTAPMSSTDVLRALVDRLGDAGADAALFLGDETADWVPGALDALINSGLLAQASPATDVICDGCEARCLRPVFFGAPASEFGPRAFVICGMRDDTGIVETDLNRLARWQVSPRMIVRFVARQLGLRMKNYDDRSPVARLGTWKGATGRRAISVEFGAKAGLRVGGSEVDLAEILEVRGGRIAIDEVELALRSDQDLEAISGSKRFQPSRVHQRRQAVRTAARNQALQDAAEALRGQHPTWSKLRIVREIRQSADFAQMSAGRIARIIGIRKI